MDFSWHVFIYDILCDTLYHFLRQTTELVALAIDEKSYRGKFDLWSIWWKALRCLCEKLSRKKIHRGRFTIFENSGFD